MRVAERATPVAAVIAAFSTLACCLPLGFLGAVGLAGLTIWAQSLRGWFLGLAIALLVVGFVELYRGRNQCKKRSPAEYHQPAFIDGPVVHATPQEAKQLSALSGGSR
jgi:hypothetical protein